MEYFARTVLRAQASSRQKAEWLIDKARFFNRFAGQLNSRQEKVIRRLFSAGPTGFEGGLSAENYIALTKTSRATATRDLQDLVAKGALRRFGQLKHTRYWLLP
jgi:Fic family protein